MLTPLRLLENQFPDFYAKDKEVTAD